MNSDTGGPGFLKEQNSPRPLQIFQYLWVFFFFFNEDMLKQNLGNLGYTLNICICQTHAFNAEKNYKAVSLCYS